MAPLSRKPISESPKELERVVRVFTALPAHPAFIREWHEPRLCLARKVGPHFTDPGKTELVIQPVTYECGVWT